MPRTPRQSIPLRGSGIGSALPFATKVGRALAFGFGLGLTSFALSPTTALAQVPGPEIFAKNPTTPLELWDAIDYLVRTEQAPKSVLYLNKFLKNKPGDADLIKIRDTYGFGSILRLQDNPATRSAAEPIVKMIIEAGQRIAMDPERIAGAVKLLSASPSEQFIGLERLKQVGPYAVSPILDALKETDLKPEDRALILKNLGKLDRAAVPPLIAALDAKDDALAANIAASLGKIGDLRAVPWLTLAASRPVTSALLRDAASEAVGRITRLPLDAQPKAPLPLLISEARRYQTHAIQFPGDSVTVWNWNVDEQNVTSKTLSKSEAEAEIGGKLVKGALTLDPTSIPAKALKIGLEMEKAIERSGFAGFPKKDPGHTYEEAVKSGPEVLAVVLNHAILDGKSDLAAFAAKAYGDLVAKDKGIAIEPLLKALGASGRRARFAAAKAIVELDLSSPFAGSSRVVPILAQFATTGPISRAVVIDGNQASGSQLVSYFKILGYDPILSATGKDGFRDVVETADVELVAIEISMVGEGWRLHDTVSNLRNDARSASLPIYLVGPLKAQVDLASLNERFPGLKMIVTPFNPQTLKAQMVIVGGTDPLPTAERLGYTKEATDLLARITKTPGSPFLPDLNAIEPTLALALNASQTESAATEVLSRIPDANAQRELAKLVSDPSHADDLRVASANLLSKGIAKFGPLIDATQEARLVDAFQSEPESKLKTALADVLKALKRSPRLRAPKPSATATPEEVIRE